MTGLLSSLADRLLWPLSRGRRRMADQMVIAGATLSGSSKVPARTMTTFGRASVSLNTGVPQTGQNRRCMTLPLALRLA